MLENKTSEADRCPPTGCIDDLCRGSGHCLFTGMPLAERCMGCGVAVIRELDEDCDCPPYDPYAQGRELCSCAYCPCTTETKNGGVCGMCASGMHGG